MMNHLVHKSFFVNDIRWPWKFVFNHENDSWTAWSGNDGGKKDGIRRGWDFQGEFETYEGLKDAIEYAKGQAVTIANMLDERRAGGQ